MALLELRDIGKIYVSNQNVAVGIRGVNLSFDRGEFVAVTGKSGSGKSTLLNIISGMDTYEEGELLIEGNTTSHYIQSNWEDYRQKYISFIFQDYNIIDNFTVLQNVELALMDNYDPIERRKKALELLDRVGLSKAIHQKGSKLSGGQKQRTVIARALAKDSPIILADEPTGNLDSETSKEIIDLLHEVSTNKLVIVVTHNFEQVEEYATRHIRIYDGSVESDQELTNHNIITDEANSKIDEPKNRDFLNGFLLGRIMFLSKPKLTIFLCILMIVGVLSCFFLTVSSNGASDFFKPTYMFNDIDGRAVIVKENGTIITDNELETLKTKTGALSVVHYDQMFDVSVPFYDVACYPSINEKFSNIVGRYPESKDEVFLYVPISVKDYLIDDLLGQKIGLYNIYYKVVGYKFFYDNTKQAKYVFTEEGLKYLNYGYILNNANVTVYYDDGGVVNDVQVSLYPSFDIQEGKFAVFGEVYNRLMKDNTSISVSGKLSLSYIPHETTNSERKNLVLNLTKNQFDTSFEEINQEKWRSESIYVSFSLLEDMANEALTKSYRQASLFYSSNSKAKSAANSISNEDYLAVPARTKSSDNSYQVIIQTITDLFSLIGLLIGLSFLILFINLCTSKSVLALRADMSIMRSMGIKVKTIKVAMYVRMLIALIPGYIILALVATLIYVTPSQNATYQFMHVGGYILIVIGTLYVATMVARKQIKKLFNQSVKTSLVGGDEQ